MTSRLAAFTTLILIFCPILAFAQSWREVDPDIFRRSVDRQMTNRVMGYAFVVADADSIVGEAAGGWAQAPGDGDLRMTTSIPIGFGSNQKVLSGVALLDLLESRPPPVAEQLETPIYFFLPDKWRETYFRGNIEVPKDWITLRDILDHTSGLAQESANGGAAGTIIARALAAPMLTVDHSLNKVVYNNNNYTLLLYIIPTVAYPDAVADIEEGAAHMELADYNRHISREYGALYTRYMNERFLPRVPETIVAGCRQSELPAGIYAKQYDQKLDDVGFTDDAPDYCRSQGSWSYSARGLAHIWRAMEFGDTFVDRSTRRLYRASQSGPRMIYWRSFSHPFLARNSAIDTYRGHAGRTPSLSGDPEFDDRANSVAIRLPFGHVGIAAVNSDEMGGVALATVLLNAFYEATRETFEKDVNRPGKDIANIFLNDPDPAQCHMACQDNPSCKSWTFVAPGVQDPVRARCWLKDDIPAQQARAGRVSGVKGLEYGWNRPGKDFRTVDLPNNDPAACRIHCAFDRRCKSWTFVKAGVQKSNAVCWLKDATPSRRRANCCVSGK